MHIRTLLTIALLTVAAPCFAETPATQSAAAATEPASQPASFQATEKDAIAKAVDSTVTVTGTVSRTSWYNDQILFINFKGTERGDFTVIARQESREALDKAFKGDVAGTLDGKKIAVTGKIVMYRGHPEIVIAKPEQVTILPDDKAAEGAGAATEPAK
jgi:micrococcal nuclease